MVNRRDRASAVERQVSTGLWPVLQACTYAAVKDAVSFTPPLQRGATMCASTPRTTSTDPSHPPAAVVDTGTAVAPPLLPPAATLLPWVWRLCLLRMLTCDDHHQHSSRDGEEGDAVDEAWGAAEAKVRSFPPPLPLPRLHTHTLTHTRTRTRTRTRTHTYTRICTCTC